MSPRSCLIYFRTLLCRSDGSINYTVRTAVRLYVSLETRAEWRTTNLFWVSIKSRTTTIHIHMFFRKEDTCYKRVLGFSEFVLVFYNTSCQSWKLWFSPLFMFGVSEHCIVRPSHLLFLTMPKHVRMISTSPSTNLSAVEARQLPEYCWDRVHQHPSPYWRGRVWLSVWCVHQRPRSRQHRRHQAPLRSRHTMPSTGFRLFAHPPHNWPTRPRRPCRWKQDLTWILWVELSTLFFCHVCFYLQQYKEGRSPKGIKKCHTKTMNVEE
jgi:hypothetical protein